MSMRTASIASSSITARAPRSPSSTCTPMCSAISRRTSSLASDDQNITTERIYADGVAMVQLLGPQDRLLRMLEKEHPDVQVLVRGNEITLEGTTDAVSAAKLLVDELLTMTRQGHNLLPTDLS